MKVAGLLVAALLLTGCRDGGKEEAEQAVRTYLARVIDAYRTSDASLVDPLVGDQQGQKLLGLIGVKRDAGVVLDARLLEIEFTRMAREGDGWVVETRERWYYKDRKIGSGEQMGEDSTDAYAMRYRFARKGGKLILEDLAFAVPPQVGRKLAPLPDDVRVLHGLPPAGGEQAVPAGHPPVPGAGQPGEKKP